MFSHCSPSCLSGIHMCNRDSPHANRHFCNMKKCPWTLLTRPSSRQDPKPFNHQKGGNETCFPHLLLFPLYGSPIQTVLSSSETTHLKEPHHAFLVFAQPLRGHVKSADSASSKTPCKGLWRTEGQGQFTDQLTGGATHWLISFFIYYLSSLDLMGSLAFAAYVFNGEVVW